MIVQIGQKMVRRDEIDVLVVVSAEQILEGTVSAGEVISSTERHHLAEQLGTPERKAHRVVRADTTTMNNERGNPFLRAHERNHLVEDVAFVLTMAIDARLWRNAAAVEAFRIDGIDTEKAGVAALDGMAKRIHQSPVFVIVESSFMSKKKWGRTVIKS